MVNGTRNDAMTVPAAEGKLRFWRNTGIATLAAGQIATLPAGTLGYEWDEDVDNGFRPAGLMQLSSTTVDVTTAVSSGLRSHVRRRHRHAQPDAVPPQQRRARVRRRHGAVVVGPRRHARSRRDRRRIVRMQQATVNLFADMGVQPRSLRAGSERRPRRRPTRQPPTSTFTAPAAGATVQSGTPVTITGTAADAGGGVVGGVEVSVDGGATWRAAAGRASWSYVWTPAALSTTPRSATLLSRAVDDSGNIETPGPGRTVTVLPLGGLVAAYGFSEGSGTTVADISGNGNTGTIAGATWTTGRFGQALSFDGVNDWVTVNDANSLDLTDGMTLEAWINPTALSGWQSAIIKDDDDEPVVRVVRERQPAAAGRRPSAWRQRHQHAGRRAACR